MEQQTEKVKKPQTGMPYDEGVTEDGKCTLCGGEVEHVFHSVHEQDGWEEIVDDFKCQSCGNETFTIGQ